MITEKQIEQANSQAEIEWEQYSKTALCQFRVFGDTIENLKKEIINQLRYAGRWIVVLPFIVLISVFTLIAWIMDLLENKNA